MTTGTRFNYDSGDLIDSAALDDLLADLAALRGVERPEPPDDAALVEPEEEEEDAIRVQEDEAAVAGMRHVTAEIERRLAADRWIADAADRVEAAGPDDREGVLGALDPRGRRAVEAELRRRREARCREAIAVGDMSPGERAFYGTEAQS